MQNADDAQTFYPECQSAFDTRVISFNTNTFSLFFLLWLYLAESDGEYRRELAAGTFSRFYCVDALATGTFSHSFSLFLEALIGCTATLLSPL